MKALLFILGVIFIFSGCQVKPTKVTNQEPVLAEGVSAESLMAGHPVILDVRPAFEFNLAHVPGAVNVRWEDFSQSNPRSRGLLQSDLYGLARRLALIGVDPSTKVLVLGKGVGGAGEEGRIAWTLMVLGIRDVHTLVHTSYRELNTTREVAPTKNRPSWKPEVDESLTISLKDFRAEVLPKDGEVVVLDVRMASEFGLRNLSADKKVGSRVVNVVWTEFFDEKGLPKRNLETVLAAKGIHKNTKVMVISTHGVRSGAATYALRSAGYSAARNFAGGYEQWK